MSEPVEVWYWVRGIPLSQVFSIHTSLNTTLLTVEERIMESWLRKCGRDFSGISSLYKIPQMHPLDLESDGFVDALGALSISDLYPLRITRTKTLADTFAPQFLSDHLHFILDCSDFPTYPITCRIRGGSPKEADIVELAGDQMLGSALKFRAKESWPPLQDLPLVDLQLYKISFKDDNELKEVLQCMGEGDHIPTNQKARDVFHNMPFCSNTLHVVIEVATSQRLTVPLSSRRGRYAASKDAPAPTVEGERSKFLRKNRPQSPSTTAAPSTFRKRQNSDAQVIPCGRPREHEDRIPLTLLHSVFAQFKDDIHNISLTAADDIFVIDLANAMCKIYSDEARRVEEIKSVLKTYDIYLNISRTHTAGFETDGDMSTLGYRYVLAEFKNEVGCVAKEPYFQEIAYYLEFTRTEAVKMSHSPLPCLLMSIYGSNIDFAGIAWNLRPTAQLLARVAFHVHSTDTADLLVLARHMAAFREASRTLKEYYNHLESPESSRLSPPQLFPHPAWYTSRITQQRVEIIYKHQISEKQLVFFGFEDSDKGLPICIKFVRQYSPDAHDYCVSLGCAPTLRGFETIVGGWFMVIMDDISDGYETLYDRPVTESVKDIIAEKLSKFHAAGYVHGDLRDTNIMASKSDTTDVKFIDFDWAGKANETVYPPFVNREFWRPPDAMDWLPIRAEHDVEMLRHITDWVPVSRVEQ
ncbi:hypothetical protein JVU11DRAFT_9099 [Chiua virens]|nr:hypothetical protein JVU11DRAFT_9099 [Chiua virens]